MKEEIKKLLSVLPPEKLFVLADYLDKIDEEKGYEGKDVQRDLRLAAKLLDQYRKKLILQGEI